MRKIFSAIATAAAALAMVASAPGAVAKPKPSGEEQLAKMLEGREAGEPQSCISMFDSYNLRVIHRTALVYKRGDTVWVNRPANPEDLDYFDVLVMKRTGSQLCKQDIVTTMDQSTHMFTGSVFLGDFVPYKKVK
ncbi:MAG: hypothetical protein R3E21_06145 [Caenibius sp.]